MLLIYYTIGSTSVILDEIFLYADYMVSRDRWEKEKAKFEELRTKKKRQKGQ
jgi:hypothetical protein